MPRRSALVGAMLALLAGAAGGGSWDGSAPGPELEPAATGGLPAIDRALGRLSVHRRLLVVGAHPDDEDNALLTYASRHLDAEVAYLSLSRGEGGQNLLGPELGVELGLIRTGELMAARRVEGTRQFFARARDFGYTRSLEETFARWPREILLGDAVAVARLFMPQVVVAIFPADARAGHGQHQASAVVAAELVERGGDPRAHPETLERGLFPWPIAALFRRAWSGVEATVELPLSHLEPWSGRSLAQVAAASRSLHRTQDMGRQQPLGERRAGLVWLAGGGGAAADELFAGVDTRLAAIASSLAEGPVRTGVAERLTAVAELARAARRELSPARPAAAVAPLAEIAALLDQARDLVARSTQPPPRRAPVLALLAEKRGAAAAGLAAAAGVAVDAVADGDELAPGESFIVHAEIWPAGEAPVVVEVVELDAARGWKIGEPEQVVAGGVERWSFPVTLADDAEPSRPYHLAAPPVGDLYDWSAAAAEERGAPWSRPPLLATFVLEIAGTPLTLVREVVHSYGDQAVGEVRRPLAAVPALEVAPERRRILARRDAPAPSLEAVLQSNVARPLTGELRLETPPRWPRGERLPFALAPRGAATIALPLPIPAAAADGVHRLRLVAESGGRAYAAAYPLIEYPHVRPVTAPRPAVVELSVVELELPPLGPIGYVRGASDRVPEILAELGLDVRLLGGEELARGELGGYDAIVVGSRAYETDAALAGANPRLLAYAAAGGTLIVQYQQYQFVEGGYAPGQLEIARPHGRVTDEGAAVEILAPEHPALTYPHPIGPGDWEGWVQERGLYFAASWDERYRPLVAMADPGREPERGALLVAPLGDGYYVYTGLSFFRQLPAGVPGALRLWVNLLALGSQP